MIYIYYHVTAPDEYKEKLAEYFAEGRKHGLVRLMQRTDQPTLFTEIVNVDSNIGEPLKGLSDLRSKYEMNKLILNNRIHVEVFDVLLESSEQGQQ